MQTFLGLLGLVGLVALGVGAIAICKPNKWLKQRWQGGVVAAAGVIAILIVGSAAPPPAPATPSPAAGAKREGPSKPKGPSAADIKASFSTTQAAVFAAAKPCDEAIAKASRTRSIQASYEISRAAEALCRQAGLDIDNAHFSDLGSSDAEDGLNKAVDCIGLSYIARSTAMGDAAKLMDGDQRPSQIAAFREEMSQAMSDFQQCEVQYLAAADKYGFGDLIDPGHGEKRRGAKAPAEPSR